MNGFLEPKNIREFPEWMNDATRKEVLHEGMNRRSANAMFGFWVLAFITPTVVWGVLWWLAPTWWWLARAGVFVALTTLLEWPLLEWQKTIFLRSVRGVLRERGMNICSVCGYSLEGLDGAGRCPECGSEVASMPPVGPTVYGVVSRDGKVQCSKCGYDLDGLSNPKRCPECGGNISGAQTPASRAEPI